MLSIPKMDFSISRLEFPIIFVTLNYRVTDIYFRNLVKKSLNICHIQALRTMRITKFKSSDYCWNAYFTPDYRSNYNIANLSDLHIAGVLDRIEGARLMFKKITITYQHLYLLCHDQRYRDRDIISFYVTVTLLQK